MSAIQVSNSGLRKLRRAIRPSNGQVRQRLKPPPTGRTRWASSRRAAVASPPANFQAGVDALRRRLAQVEADLVACQHKATWLESALDEQRNARQMLEASLANTYGDTIGRIRDLVNAVIPNGKTVLVVSKGDADLLELDGRMGWHFPQDEHGAYAGYYPADSVAAIEQLKSLVAKGADFLLFPNSAFWWLEHYHALEAWLTQCHKRVWRDECCAIYRLSRPAAGQDAQNAGRILPHLSDINAAETPALAALPDSPAHHDLIFGTEALPGVVCFPIIDWGFRFQRPQHLMREFAAVGHQVFYLSHRFRKTGEPCMLRPLLQGIQEVSLRGPRFDVDPDLMDRRSLELLLESLAHLPIRSSAGAHLAIVQSPFWWPLAERSATQFGWPVVYDCMDDHSGFPNSSPLTIELEQQLLSRADLVLASSALLEAKARAFNGNVMLLRNACDYPHFSRVRTRRPGKRPTIGYFGAIAQWFDSELVTKLAESRPDWDFVLIGSTFGADLKQLSRLQNVMLPGERPYEELPSWLEKFDVTILPFRRTPLTDAADPVKAYEILAAGKPLVSVPLPEILPVRPLVTLASTAGEFEQAIVQELARQGTDLVLTRRRFAKQHTWHRRFQQLYPAIQALLPKGNRPGRQRQARAAGRQPEAFQNHPEPQELQNV
jgi:hypothetical protein